MMLNALASQNKVNIVSNPHVMTSENKKAVINVSTSVPIVTSQTTGQVAAALRHCGLPPSFSLSLVRQREQIERNFGNATMCGLRTPPPWVRRPHRVATWVAAKLIECMLRQVELRKLQRR